MYKIIYSYESNNDLTTIFNYISEDSYDRAVLYLAEIETSILKLVDFPKMGSASRYEELKVQGIHILPHDNYLIFYKINATCKQIEIVRVLHGSRNYINLF